MTRLADGMHADSIGLNIFELLGVLRDQKREEKILWEGICMVCKSMSVLKV